MDKLFRRVSVKDRDPEKYGYYDTAVGNIEYSPTNGWQWGMPNPDYWLEEIQLPTEEDILEHARSEKGLEDYDIEQDVFVDGANYILNTILGKEVKG